MIDKKQTSNVTPLRPLPERPATSIKSLDRRLEDARARREKALAAKGKKTDSAPKLSKPWIEEGQAASDEDDFDPAARAALLAQATQDASPDPSGNKVAATPAAQDGAPKPRKTLRPAFSLSLVAATALLAGSVLTNLDRLLPELPSPAATPATPRAVAMSTAPVPGTYLGWDPAVRRHDATDARPEFGTPDVLAAASSSHESAAPVRGQETPMTSRPVGSDTFDLPPSLTARVRLFAPVGVPGEDVQRLSAFLEGYRLDVGALTPVSFPVEANEVRYRHRADRDTALALARLLGASVRKYPVDRDNPPEAGIVEVWIAGE